MLFGFGVSIISLETLLHNGGDLVKFMLVKCLEDFGLHREFLFLFLLGFLLVAFKEHLHGIDTVRNKFFPGDLAICILVSESKKSAQIMLTQIVIFKFLECIIEFLVTEFTSFVNISFIQNSYERTLESQNESGGFNVDLLGLLDVLAEVLDLHDVVFGDKGVNLLSLLVD